MFNSSDPTHLFIFTFVHMILDMRRSWCTASWIIKLYELSARYTISPNNIYSMEIIFRVLVVLLYSDKYKT